MYFDSQFKIPTQNVQEISVGQFLFSDDSVCLVTSTNNDTAVVQHYNSTGLLRQIPLKFSVYLERVCSVEPFKMVVINSRSNTLQELDLLTGGKTTHVHKFQVGSPFKSKLKVFPETKCFCVVELFDRQTEGVRTRVSKVTLYDRELVQLYTYQRRLKEFETMTTANSRSKIVYYDPCQLDSLDILMVDLLQKSETTISALFPVPGQYRLKGITEMAGGKFLLFCESTEADTKLLEWDTNSNTISKIHANNIDQTLILSLHVAKDLLYVEMLVPSETGLFPAHIVDYHSMQIIRSFEVAIDHQHQHCIQTDSGHYRFVELKLDRRVPKFVGVKHCSIVAQKQLYANMLLDLEDFNEEMLRHIIQSFDEV